MKKAGVKKKIKQKYIVDLGEVLGFGNSATVCRGINQQTNEQVAVKIIDKSQIKSDEYMKKALIEEIRIMMKLKSTNIIGFLDQHQTNSNFYLILEMANQGSFRNILNQKKSKNEELTQKQTIKYLIQLMNGFGAMLKLGVIHRDVKPENIFVKDDKLKIGDFGLAKNNQKIDSMMSTTVGSPAYMAPQILKNAKYSYKCDIWSLGVMTYEMLVGNVPFDYTKFDFSHEKDFDKNAKKVYEIIIDTKIQYPPHIKISDEMKDFIRGCLKINQQERFDWLQLFKHPIFKGIFEQNFANIKKGEQLLAYVMGQFRMIFNQYDVDIIAELQKLNTPRMSIDKFKDLLQFLNCEIYEKESEVLVELLNKNGEINLKDFEKLMEIHECLATAKPSSNNLILTTGKKKLSLVINLIRKVNKLKPINFNELISKEIMAKQKLDQTDFSKIIKSFVPQVPDHILLQFKQKIFDSEEGKAVSIVWFIEVIKVIIKEEQIQEKQ